MNSGLTMAGRKPLSISQVDYYVPKHIRKTQHTKSIKVIGIDTEAYTTGKCFLICTSLGDIFQPKDNPHLFFTRRYRNKKFVVYNIKYDEGALLQHLPMNKLDKLRETNSCTHNGYKYFSIPRKMLKISKGKNAIEIYDIAGFYKLSLEKAASKYLGEHKEDMDNLDFTPERVTKEWDNIVKYCIQDAVLTQKLAEVLIHKFESFGVYPQKLYSTAYVSWQYFKNNCDIPLIKNIWDNHKQLLQYAMDSYNGGKFEVTEKGADYYYEADIISAYPYEIRNLIDISHAYIVHEKKYRKNSTYGFLLCDIKIPAHVYSPLAVKIGDLNTYPVGYIQKCITKEEYEYLVKVGCDITIIDAYWIITADRVKPFKYEIDKLVKVKERYKKQDKKLDYMIIKIFLNSLYGKFVQLIPRGDRFRAGYNWNVIYGSVITANCRIRISDMQQMHDSIIAVHTDSVISTKPLGFPDKGKLGDMVAETEGKGVILGSGVYQVGDKTKFRGFDTKVSLLDMIGKSKDTLKIVKKRPLSWREVAFHGWEKDMINMFTDITKNVNINFDRKRIWIDDWTTYKEVLKRKVYSTPIPHFHFLS